MTLGAVEPFLATGRPYRDLSVEDMFTVSYRQLRNVVGGDLISYHITGDNQFEALGIACRCLLKPQAVTLCAQ